jgi:hypothetical protein
LKKKVRPFFAFDYNGGHEYNHHQQAIRANASIKLWATQARAYQPYFKRETSGFALTTINDTSLGLPYLHYQIPND